MPTRTTPRPSRADRDLRHSWAAIRHDHHQRLRADVACGPGYRLVVSSPYSDEALDAIQAVVDRVSSCQDAATAGTVERESTEGLKEAGVQVDNADLGVLARAIGEEHGSIDVRSAVGR